jgi:hypothetical protein
MKLILFLAVGAFAVQDTAPPVISLNLAEMACSDTDCTRVSGQTKCARHDQCRASSQDPSCTATGTKTCTDRQSMTTSSSYARKCEYIAAGGDFSASGQKACPSPTAYAYDHNEGALNDKVTVSCTKFVVSAANTAPVRAVKGEASSTCALKQLNEGGTAEEACAGTGANKGSHCKLANAEYATRGEDVLVYSVADNSGNEAEKLVFAMIIEDTLAPSFSYTKDVSALDACRHGTSIATRCKHSMLTNDWTLDQKYDTAPRSAGQFGPFATEAAATAAAEATSITAAQKYTDVLFTPETGAGAGNAVKQHNLPKDPTGASVSTRYFRYKMTDWADIFGKDNVDNIGYSTVTVVTNDNDAPRVQLKPLSIITGDGVPTVDTCSTVVIAPLVLAAKTITVTSIVTCREYNREHYIEAWTDLPVTAQRPYCHGCKDNVCYTQGTGTNGCTPADITTESIECQHTLATAVTVTDTYVATWSTTGGTNGTFVNSGAYCTDDLESSDADGENTNTFDPEAFTTESSIDVGAVGTYTVTYTCKDSNPSNTATATRSVTVVDTTAPTVLTTTQRMEELNTANADLDKYRAGDGKGADAAAADAALSCNEDVAHGMTDNTANCTTLKKGDLGSRLGSTGTELSNYASNLMQLTKIQWSAGFHGNGGDDEALAVLGKYDESDKSATPNAHGGYRCQDTCFNEWKSTGEKKAWTTSTDGTNAGHASMWVQCKGTTDCCTSINDHKVTASAWGTTGEALFEKGTAFDSETGIMKFSKTFKSSEKGHWALLYTCNDGYTAPVMGCRTVTVEDHTKPVITILGEDETKVEASKEENYVDQGADCYDQIDKNIADKVQVSGDVVNLSRVGTYVITYSCKDTAGNSADPAERKVIVEDTTCPYCKFETNSQDITLEAGFKYVDGARFACDDGKTDHDLKCYDAYLGTSASDNCLPASVTARDYIAEWAAGTDSPDTYYAPYTTSNPSGIEIGSDGAFGSTSTFATYGLASVTGTYLLQYTTTDETGNKNYGWDLTSDTAGHCKPAMTDATTVNQAETNKPVSPNGQQKNSGDYNRKVTVVDTLRPVIKLQLGSTMVQKGKAGTETTENAVGAHVDVAKQQNAAGGAIDANTISGLHSSDKFLMSEQAQTSVNGWVLGAIASAVSGLALLGYSLRKQTQPVATSVPV